MKKFLVRMQGPAVKCAGKVYDLLLATAEQCLENGKLKPLNKRILAVLEHLVHAQLKICEKRIQEYIEIQTGMIYSSDKDFVDLLNENRQDESNLPIQPVLFKSPPAAFPFARLANLNGLTQHRVEYTGELIFLYLNVAKRELCDYIPKYLVHSLIDNTFGRILDAVVNIEKKLGLET